MPKSLYVILVAYKCVSFVDLDEGCKEKLLFRTTHYRFSVFKYYTSNNDFNELKGYPTT